MIRTEDLNVIGVERLTTPIQLKRLLPLSEKAAATVVKARKTVKEILDDRDKRLLMIIGPCSIHDPRIAIEYAGNLRKLIPQVEQTLFVIMRVYFEKPRTTIGWKGFINDPDLDGSHHIDKGVRLARQILLELNEMGVPCATETLDPITPQYLADLIAWSAIGARTTESQTHREMASGLSMPVGFKNGTDGDLEVALNALRSANEPHHFLGINHEGEASVVSTSGNKYAHLVLRGGKSGTNFDAISVRTALDALAEVNLREKVMVDCNHANSGKDPMRQELVLRALIHQIKDGRNSILGAMIESNLEAGNQSIGPEMRYGVSITDACLDWENTRRLLLDANDQLLN